MTYGYFYTNYCANIVILDEYIVIYSSFVVQRSAGVRLATRGVTLPLTNAR